jgi:hypothetical protein
MGVGDRHSRRTSKSKELLPAIRSIRQSYIVDDRELDDPFSAWDEDDAGARKPSPAMQLAHAAAAHAAPTRLERKPAAGGVDPFSKTVPVLVDPVAMRDIVLSRVRTLDGPRTARAEAARASTPGELEPATSTRPTERMPPSRLPAALAEDRPEPRDTSPTRPTRATRTTRTTRTTRKDLPPLSRRGARQPIARDEPFRKK